MKNYLKISAVVAFVFIVSSAMAQSSENGWPVSKDVNRYSNKSLVAHKPTKLKLVGTPVFVTSKMQSPSKEVTAGNVTSTYPMWTVSKGVNRIGKK
ncbi:MAG: hypothetical protein E6Q96_04300 [Cyclobacteriaceae bacterium]|nr:MAG: hypothetical protein E6Q96_04300 [Cyclobacteriaceae bacterium]